MGTKNLNSATDLITFTRASGGTALRKISYGNELVTNGSFDTDLSGWNNDGTTSAIVGNQIEVTSVSGVSGSGVDQTITTVAGKRYKFSSDHAPQTGRARIEVKDNNNFGSGLGTLPQTSATGTYEFVFVALSNSTYIRLEAFDTSSVVLFDNVSVKEFLFDQADGTLQLWNHSNNEPRIEYDATGAVKGLLIEEARTNLVKYSNEFTNGIWAKQSVTLTGGGVSPPGLTDATVITASATSEQHRVYQNLATITSYSKSVYAKAGTANFISVNGGTTSVGYAVFDLSTGVVSSQLNIVQATMEDVGSGWYRCSIHGTVATQWMIVNMGTTAANAVPQVNWLGAGETVQLYGAQLEAGAFPSSYIPTTGATATRARDLAEIPTSAFGYNNGAGSLVIDVLTPVADQIMPIAYFNTSTYNNSRGLWKSNSGITAVGTDYVRVTHDGTTTKFTIDQQTQAEYTKLGLSYGDSEKGVSDGGTVLSGDSRSPNPTRLFLGGRDNGFQSQCWIKSIQYYPRQLTDTQLQELTT